MNCVNQRRYQVTAAGEDESQFRSLTFKEEEGRVRDGADTYVPNTGSLGDGLRRLRAERNRYGQEKERPMRGWRKKGRRCRLKAVVGGILR